MINKTEFLYENRDKLEIDMSAAHKMPYRNVSGFINMNRLTLINRTKGRQKLNMRAIEYQVVMEQLHDRISRKEKR